MMSRKGLKKRFLCNLFLRFYYYYLLYKCLLCCDYFLDYLLKNYHRKLIFFSVIFLKCFLWSKCMFLVCFLERNLRIPMFWNGWLKQGSRTLFFSKIYHGMKTGKRWNCFKVSGALYFTFRINKYFSLFPPL